MTAVLNERALNRATLARQFLLDRVALPALDAVEHLAGMQAQAPLAPYVGLWTRLHDFAQGELAALIEQRQVVRLHLMRNTVHLVSARDCLDWRALFSSLHAAEFNAHFAGRLAGIDRADLIEHALRLLEERPRTRQELGRQLAARFPHADPGGLAYAVTHHVALCQVPPRGVWGRRGRATWTPVESWLRAPLRSVPVEELVLRYLGAFGPASVADIQLWSGLGRLREVVERLSLLHVRTPGGEHLYDLPDAPRPSAEVPAPPRFLPAYDNLLLSHRDRTRFIPKDRRVPLPPGNGANAGTFLVDGQWQGTWHMGEGILHLQTFTRLAQVDRDGLVAEASRLCAFLAPATTIEIVFDRPAK